MQRYTSEHFCEHLVGCEVHRTIAAPPRHREWKQIDELVDMASLTLADRLGPSAPVWKVEGMETAWTYTADTRR